MTSKFGAAAARSAADAIRTRTNVQPRVAIVLGSGLGGIAEAIERPTRIPYRDVPGFPGATVVGHAGELIAGTLGGVPVIALSGRFHLYEGHDAALAALPVRVLHALGATMLVVSNAAGGVRETLTAGTLMLITDHVNFMFRNPLLGPLEEGDVRFPDMSEPYDRELRVLAQRVALEQGVALAEGVYVGLLGPSYETRAEVKMLARLGADAVGMSTGCACSASAASPISHVVSPPPRSPMKKCSRRRRGSPHSCNGSSAESFRKSRPIDSTRSLVPAARGRAP